jgi:hypothetical protein
VGGVKIRAKDVIYDLLLGNWDADSEYPTEYATADGGVIENGEDQAMTVLLNMRTRDKFRVTVQRVT